MEIVELNKKKNSKFVLLKVPGAVEATLADCPNDITSREVAGYLPFHTYIAVRIYIYIWYFAVRIYMVRTQLFFSYSS